MGESGGSKSFLSGDERSPSNIYFFLRENERQWGCSAVYVSIHVNISDGDARWRLSLRPTVYLSITLSVSTNGINTKHIFQHIESHNETHHRQYADQCNITDRSWNNLSNSETRSNHFTVTTGVTFAQTFTSVVVGQRSANGIVLTTRIDAIIYPMLTMVSCPSRNT